MFLNTNSVISKGAGGVSWRIALRVWNPVVQTLTRVLAGGPGWPAKAARELAGKHVCKSL